MKQRIKDLIQEYLEIVNSSENAKRMSYWSQVYGWNRDMWRGIPKGGTGVPFTIAPDNSFWGQVLNVDLRDYYNNPETYLETQLRMKIYHFNNFKDNVYFTDELFIWFGVITELSYFNIPIKFFPNKEGWIDGNPIKEYDDLDRLEVPDFYKSGLMPRIHQYYEVLREYADGKLKTMFPEWVRGPFCIAAHLRGLQNILMDSALEPDFLHKLMRFIVDSSKTWNTERSKFLKEDIKSCKLYNDEVDSPTISPKMYKEIIFPYEKELSDYYGEVTYWHSCGNTTDFIEQIDQLTNLKLFHCGPWTSYKRAAEVLGSDTAVDICLNPEKDVLQATPDQMLEKLEDIKSACRNRRFFVRADGFMGDGEIEAKLNKISEWNKVALIALNNV